MRNLQSARVGVVVVMQVAVVEEVCGAQVSEGVPHGGEEVGEALLEVAEELLEIESVSMFAEGGLVGAGADGREGEEQRGLVDLLLGAAPQGADEAGLAAVGGDIGAHGLEAAASEEGEQETHAEVVEVLSQGEFVAVQFGEEAVEFASAQAGAEGAGAFAASFFEEFGDAWDGDEAEVPALALAVFAEGVAVEAWIAQVDGGGEDLDGEWQSALEGGEEVHQQQAVLAAGFLRRSSS